MKGLLMKRTEMMTKKNPNVQFTPTKPLGFTNPQSRKTLQKEAPETLIVPQRKSFSSDAGYQEAMNKFKKYGNWASNK